MQPSLPKPQIKCDAPSTAHYDYDELETPGAECDCSLCTGFRSSFVDYHAFRDMCKGHSRSCSCYLCTNKNEAQLVYLAALSKRDTYCELSYLTVGREQKKLAPQFLAWIYARMVDPAYRPESWWAIKSPTRSLAEWMIEWQTLFLPEEVWDVSGVY